MKPIRVDSYQGAIDIVKSLNLCGILSAFNQVEVDLIQVGGFGESGTWDLIERVKGESL